MKWRKYVFLLLVVVGASSIVELNRSHNNTLDCCCMGCH